jgi:glycosyltransferase involved in cell wall biosynthesis
VAKSAVDVVIPTYNRAQDIGRALDSVLAQTYPVRDIFVIDDGSRDNTEDLVASGYRDRVRYVRQSNAGPAAARNNGIGRCRADWVAFLDSDDYWMPNKLERQMAALSEATGAVLSYTRVLLQTPDGRQEEQGLVPASDPQDTLRYTNYVPMSSALVRRDLLVDMSGFDTAFKGTEDWDLWFRLSRLGEFAPSKEPLTVIVETPGSISGSADGMIENVRRLIDKTLVADLTGIEREIWRRRIMSSEYYHAFMTMRDRKAAGAKKYLFQSLREWPSPLFLPKRFASLAMPLHATVLSPAEPNTMTTPIETPIETLVSNAGSTQADLHKASAAPPRTVLFQMALVPDKVTSLLLFLSFLAQELGRRGWDLVICSQAAPSAAAKELFGANVQFEVLDQTQGWSMSSAKQLFEILGRHRPQIYIYSFNSILRPYPWIAKLRGVQRIVYNDHSSRPAHYQPRSPVFWKRLITRSITWPVDGSICISKYVEDCERREGFLAPGSVEQVYNGVDHEGLIKAAAGARGQFRQQWRIPENAPVAVQVGWMTPAKGVDKLLQSWKQVCQKFPDARLVLVGRGEQQDEYEKLAKALGIDSNVIFAGMVDSPAGAYAAADVYCQMSQWQEGFAVVLAEAMALGLPTVGTRVGGIPEVVEDGVTGFLLNQDDIDGTAARLIQLFGDEALRQRMGSAGRERAQRMFRIDQMVAGYLRCLRL